MVTATSIQWTTKNNDEGYTPRVLMPPDIYSVKLSESFTEFFSYRELLIEGSSLSVSIALQFVTL